MSAQDNIDDETMQGQEEEELEEGAEEALEEEVVIEDEADGLAVVERYFRNRSDIRDSPFMWKHIAEWTDEDPFIGYWAGAQGVSMYSDYTLEDVTGAMYSDIGGDPTVTLPLKPADVLRTTKTTDIDVEFPTWRKVSLEGYTAVSSLPPPPPPVIAEISKTLSGLLAHPLEGSNWFFQEEKGPSAPAVKVRQMKQFKEREDARKAGTALIARAVLSGHPGVVQCVPVRFNAPHVLPEEERHLGLSNEEFHTRWPMLDNHYERNSRGAHCYKSLMRGCYRTIRSKAVYINVASTIPAEGIGIPKTPNLLPGFTSNVGSCVLGSTPAHDSRRLFIPPKVN